MDGTSSRVVQIHVNTWTDVDLLSEDAKTRVDRQTKTVHGLPFEPFLSDHNNRHEFHPYHQLRVDVIRWCQQYLTPERWRLGVLTGNGLYRLFQGPRFSYPIVVLEGQGCRELSSLPIATVNVMATNDHGQNWCHDHLHGERGTWHDCCARVRTSQMFGWLRRHSNVLPTLSQVNAQRVLWQKRCDRLLDEVLCNDCIDDKDEAFAREKGLDWIPDNCSECRTVRRIFEQTVIYREWQEPLFMPMMSRTPCGLGIPCPSQNKH